MNQLPLMDVIRAFRAAGAVRFLAKRMAENDNSKNQVYLGGGFALLNELPLRNFRAQPSKAGRAIIHADLPLAWLRDDGTLANAPDSKVILYPQYPEVRWSGFLNRAPGSPSALMNGHARIAGRVVIFGIRDDRTVVARVFAPDSPVAREIEERHAFGQGGVIAPLDIEDTDSNRDQLLAALRQVADKGWVDPIRLLADGSTAPCVGQNCGGVTLESLLGIRPNSRAEPDLFGWEVKQFAVANFQRFTARSPITVFTPEPTGGVYTTEGVDTFVRRWGYPDTNGVADRWNFGGRFTVGRRLARTGLTLRVSGTGANGDTIVDSDGGVQLVDDNGIIAAEWSFPALLAHWNLKHAKAAYVPSIRREPPRQYQYSRDVFLATGTDFGLFLRAMSRQAIVYDPGIKLENASGPSPRAKRRNQFRVSFTNLRELYHRFEAVGIM
jgi:hypothetical protein